MKVIINGRFLSQKTTGVQRYARELLAELDYLAVDREIILAVPEEVQAIPSYSHIRVEIIGKLKNQLWENISFPHYVKKNHGISVNLCNSAPLVSPGIVCIHDVKIKTLPGSFSNAFRIWYELLFWNETKRAIKIITVSNFSKAEIMKYYRVESERITVIPDAWQHFERVGYDLYALNKYGLVENGYYFALSSLEPNKNFKWITEVAVRNPGEIFAVAGSVNRRVFIQNSKTNLPNNVKLLGYISDEEAKTLMRCSKAFLFPTYYEGFGMPPLEALSAGARRLVVSDTNIMHDMFDADANYVDPDNYDIHLPGLKEMSDEQRLMILKKFSWRDSAEKLLVLLDAVCSGEYK